VKGEKVLPDVLGSPEYVNVAVPQVLRLGDGPGSLARG
jgi:hypothetical protein